MARIFMSGAERGDLSEVFSSSYLSVAAGTRPGGLGARYYSLGTSTSTGRNAVFAFTPATGEVYIRLWHGLTVVNDATVKELIRVTASNGTVLMNLTGSYTTGIVVRKGASTTIASTGVVVGSAWHMYEIHIAVAEGQYKVELKIDGVQVCDYEDATPPSTLSPGRLYIFDQYSWDGFRVSFDDIGVNDISGSVNNSWLGDGTIVALHPSGAGDATQWVDKSGNQTSNYASVDDIAPDGDTTYVSAATPDLIDWYHLQDISLAEGSAIKAVVAAANGRVVTADGDTLSVGLKLGEDEVWIDPAVMTTSYAWIEMPIVNLALDNAPWNSDKINSLQIGIKSGLGS